MANLPWRKPREAGSHLWGKRIAGGRCWPLRGDRGPRYLIGRATRGGEDARSAGGDGLAARARVVLWETGQRGVRPVPGGEPVVDQPGRRASRHAASLRGGARVIGRSPRRKISTIRIGPPQQGHGSRRVSGMTSALGACGSRSGVACPRRSRIRAMVALRWLRPAGRSAGCGGSPRAGRGSGTGG